MNPFSDQIQSIKSAIKTTASQVRGSVMNQVDNQLRAYEKMTPDDFALLEARHGTDFVEKFIKQMETRRATGGSNGKNR